MTQEEKQLLFKDLCARTPYSVIVRNIKLGFDGYVISLAKYQPLCVLTYDLSSGEDQGFSPIEDIRPYLRPMSSMTEEECEEVGKHITIYDTVDWMNKHHFDYHGLIEKGLALEAKEGMYKTE